MDNTATVLGARECTVSIDDAQAREKRHEVLPSKAYRCYKQVQITCKEVMSNILFCVRGPPRPAWDPFRHAYGDLVQVGAPLICAAIVFLTVH